MTLTKIPSHKTCCTYGHGPLKSLLLRRRWTMTMTKVPSKKICCTYGHGPLKVLSQIISATTVRSFVPWSSFPCCFGKKQRKASKKQGSFLPSEPLKFLGKKIKALKKKGNPCKWKSKEIQKARKRRLGFWDEQWSWVHRCRSDTTANAHANSDAPRKFASECLPPNLKEKAAN